MKRIYLLLFILLITSRSFATVDGITGSLNVCTGFTTSLASTTTGGTWSSAVTAVGTINATTGVLTGMTAGTTTVTYTVGVEFAIAVVTVNPLPSPIVGASTVCEGGTTSLSSITTGGTWSVLPGGCVVTGGVVTGITAGTSVITYTAPATGCYVTTVVTIMVTPASITGSLAMCDGWTTSLSSATPGGTWTSANAAIATISSSGVAVGLASGTATISYTMPTGCRATAVVTVNPLPSAITGSMNVCEGSTTVLSTATPSGTWSSSNPAIGTIDGSGVLIGISAGTTVITYTLASTGCSRMAWVTVNPAPPAITGTPTLCLGGTTTLSNVVTGGVWSSSSPAIAMADMTTGVVSGYSLGMTAISYTLPTGCSTTIMVTVNMGSGGTISGTTAACVGSTSTLSNTVTGGTWVSSNVAVAYVGSSSGIVTGVAGGVTYITYVVPTGCMSTTAFTVNAVPAITGIPTVCTGLTTTLSNAMSGGTWSNGGSSIATVSSTGVVTGAATGTANITYTAACGAVTKTVTVIASIPAITGPSTMCEGATATFTNAATGGAWSTSGAGVAVIGTSTGLVNSVTSGAVTISYSVGACGSVTAPFTINPRPASITGTVNICPGSTATLSTTSTGGLWSNTGAAASVDFTTGVVTGITAGTANITYAFSTGCNTTKVVTVNPQPGITGSSTVCVGGTTTLTLTGASSISSSTPSVAATIGGGMISGVSLGTATITVGNGWGCTNTHLITATSTCTGTPTGGTTVSSGATCSGATVALSLSGASVVCGVTHQWQSSPDGTTWTNIAGATAATYAATTSTAKYYHSVLTCTSTGLSGTSSSFFFNPVFTIASHSTVSVPDTSCGSSHFYVTACGMSSTLTLKTYFGDGASSTGALTLTGLVYNVHVYHIYDLPGTYSVKHVLYNGGVALDSVTYAYDYMYCRTLPIKLYKDNNSNCTFDGGDVSNTIAASVRVDSAGVPIDTLSCTSGLYYKAKGPAGTIYAFRVLSMAGSMVVTCPSSGVIYDTIVSYTNTYSTKYFGLECGTSTAHELSLSTTTNARANWYGAVVYVTNTQCTAVSPVVKMTFSPKYSYSGMAPWYTYPAPTSVVGNVITWNLSSLSAGASQTINVRLFPTAPPLTLADTTQTTFTVGPFTGDLDTTNNTDTRNDTIKAAMDPNDIAVSPAGYVLPCTQLRYTIRFENDGNDTAQNIYVLDTLSNNLDPASIEVVSATAAMYVSVINDGVRNIAKFDFPNIKLLDSSHHGQCQGMFIYKIKARSALADGALINNRVGIYFDDNGVVMTNQVTNTIGVAPINGPSSLCTGTSTTLFSASTGGAWSSSSGAATVSAGVVNGVSAGTSTISYAVSNSCGTRYATKALTVNAAPSLSAITGTAGVCTGANTTLANSTSGGVWSGGASGIATVSSAGVVSGIGTGTATISYTATNACGTSTVTKVVSVDATPSAGTLTGTTGLCVGGTTTLVSTVSGGTWSVSSGGTIVTVSGGTVTGIAAGTATVFYYVTNSCATDIASVVVTVNTMPVAGTITGTSSVCIGSPVTFSTTGTGGAWTSGSSSIATVSSSGVVSGAAAGSTVITYTKANACGTATATYPVTVSAVVTPAVSVSTPSTTVCAGAITSFAATPTSGGTSPAYVWKVNGIAAGTGSTYSYTPVTGDIVSVKLTSDASCATPDTAVASITLTVLSVGMPSVVATSSATGAICDGTPVTFTATSALGGTTPVFIWIKNGVPASTGATYSYTPAMGDVVSCKLVSDYQCRLADTVSSADMTMVVDPVYTPVVLLSATPGFTILAGTTVTFTAAATGAGPTPTYAWLQNGVVIAGATNSTYTTSAVAEGDAICCKVTGSGACAIPTSSCDVVHVTSGIKETPADNVVTVFPNPTNGFLTLQGTVITTDESAPFEILDLLGQVVYNGIATIDKGRINEKVQLKPELANGMYVLRLHSISTAKEMHFVLMR